MHRLLTLTLRDGARRRSVPTNNEEALMGIRIGSPAPEAGVDYWIRGAHGPKRMTLAEHRGKWVVLFFYPRDFTFICPPNSLRSGSWRPTSRPRKRLSSGPAPTASSATRHGSKATRGCCA